MAGRDTNYDNTYITPSAVYRASIDAIDPSPLVDTLGNDIPDIRVDINPGKRVYDAEAAYLPKYEVAARGYNAHLELYIHLETEEAVPRTGIIDGLLPVSSDVDHANIRVWAWSGAHNVLGHWCLVHEQSVVCDTLIVLRDIPNTKYRVTVSELSANTVVTAINEQHTV